MTRRWLAWLAAVLACAGAGGLGVSCSGGEAAPAAGSADASGDDAAGLDATQASDAPPADAGVDQVLHGNCEPVLGPCDLVLQDCPAGKQCTTQPLSGGGYTTACTATHPVQHIDRGYPCCRPSSPVDDPCLPGLTCVGDPCTGDAGGGRCAPYCCAKDDAPCAASPEGFAGHCDEGVVDTSGKVLYDVCDYAPPCKPLHLLPCPSGYGCLVQDTSGSARCSQIFNGGSPAATEGQPCQYDNSCQDGLMCFTTTGADGGQASTCMISATRARGRRRSTPARWRWAPARAAAPERSSARRRRRSSRPGWGSACHEVVLRAEPRWISRSCATTTRTSPCCASCATTAAPIRRPIRGSPARRCCAPTARCAASASSTRG